MSLARPPEKADSAARTADAAAASVIRRRAKIERNTGFEALRAQAITLLQQTSGGVWTDHNLHDPGITTLEALCYALTETAFRSEFPVADLLAGPDDRIDYPALSLHPPQDAFPCSATTPEDHSRRLLDRVEGLDDARLVPYRSGQHEAHEADAALPGLMRLWLKLSEGDAAQQQQREILALATYRAERGLGEDIHPQADRVRPLHCALYGSIEISGAHEGAELLAEVYHRAAQYIDGSIRLLSRRALREQGLPLEDIYDGPAVEQGFLPTQAAAQAPQPRLYVSDLLQHLQATVPGVQSVERLRLVLAEPDPATAPNPSAGPQAANAPAAPDANAAYLPWRSDTHALQLILPGSPERVGGAQGLQAPPLGLTRRGQPVPVDAEELQWRVHNLQSADRARRLREKAHLLAEQADDLPRGQYRPAGAYRSVQDDFPGLYGLGAHGLPDSTEPARRARAQQLQAYLMLFDQVIANGRAQTSHLAQLFSGAGGRHKTYWWTVLNPPAVLGEIDLGVPGARDLVLDDPATIEHQVLAPLDRANGRRHQVLDHLLALHGEALGQNAMRQYGGHLDAAELEQLLLDNKASYLRDIVPLSRHRARGFDYSRPLWDERHADNFCGLARRTALLLGWRLNHARPLMQKLHKSELKLAPDPQAWQSETVDAATAAKASPLRLRRPTAERARVRSLLADLGLHQGARLPTALLRAGAAHDGYRLLGSPDLSATTLLLRDGPGGPWRVLRRYEGPEHRETAIQAAWALRDTLLRLNDYSEGLHLVEHLLLRPMGTVHDEPAATQWARLKAASFFTLRLTAVLPDWTVRTHQPGFMLLASETLHINCPVHLDLDVLPMDPSRLQDFETAYATWLQARRAHALQPAPVPETLTAALDTAALAVCLQLLPTLA